jgi:amino acid transporter
MLAMGQDGALPRGFFGVVHPKNQIPRNNVLLIGGICLVGALFMSYQLGTELLNYGALLAFMGVNAAALLQAWQEGRFRLWLPMLLALCGFLTCLVIWVGLRRIAFIVGTIWAALGVVLWLVRRRQTHLPDSEA